MTTLKFYYTKALIYSCVAISAAMSSQYGLAMAGEGANLIEKITLGATFVMFDLMIVLIAAEASNKFLTKNAARLLFIVLFTMSTVSGAGYMLGHQAEGQSMRITMLNRQIDQLDANIAKLDPVTRPGNLRELSRQRDKAYGELQGVITDQGGEVNKSNAIFVYASKLIGIDANGIATIMRLIAMVSLNLSGIVLSAWLNQNYERAGFYKAKASAKKATHSAKGKNDNAPYVKVKKAIKGREVKPSVAAIAKTFCGNNRAMADIILARLERDGIVRNQGQGKPRLLIA